jgi:hypothetical protein
MKKIYLTILLEACIIIASVFPGTAHSQDLTDEQKLERCQNNKNRIVELETQLRVINAELSQSMEPKEIENARDKMIFMKRIRALEFIDLSKEKLDSIKRISKEYYDNEAYLACEPYYSNTYPSHPIFNQCIRDLENIIGRKIDKGVSLLSKKTELTTNKADIEKQISDHRTNLIALGCDRKTSPGGGSLKLVGPDLLGKSRKESYNAVVYTEYAYTNNSATLTIQGDPPDRKMIKWQFEGIPTSLSPGDSVEITITGSIQINKGGDIQPWPSAGVRATGLTLISGENAYVSAKQNKDGKYVFKVPADAESCTIEIGADWGLGTFARYRYEKLKLPNPR